MASSTVYIALILAILAAPVSVVYADGPGPTPTPGNPGGDHAFPLPSIPEIEDLKGKYGIPDADDPSLHQINFFWDLDNWITFAESSRIGVWFVNNRSYGLLIVLFVLLLVLQIIRSMSESVYGAGIRGRDRVISGDYDRED